MTDYLNLNEQSSQEETKLPVTVVARGVTKTSINTQGTAFITFVRSTASEAGFGNKIAVKLDGVVVSKENLETEDFSGKTLVVESYNSAA